MEKNSIRLAKQASLAIKFTFNSILLRVEYNTNRLLNGIVKDATPTHYLSNIVYMLIQLVPVKKTIQKKKLNTNTIV